MTEINDVIYLDLEDFKTIVDQLISAKEEFSEDMPPYETRYPGKLESIIGQIYSSYFGVEQYPSLEEKASRLFYLLNKNHPFINGNKRVAVAAFFVFLSMNTEELYFDEETINNELYEIATLTASSLPDEIEDVMDMLISKTKQYIYFH